MSSFALGCMGPERRSSILMHMLPWPEWQPSILMHMLPEDILLRARPVLFQAMLGIPEF